jgi:predicted SnoaL-like aldol condensation-catalyzing enzyme
MRAIVAAFDSGEVGAADSVVHDDYLDHQGLPHARPLRGISGFTHVVEVARSGYVELSVEIVDLIEGDDRAAARLVWAGARRTGEATRRETLEIVRVRNGKAIEHWGGHS